MGYLLFLLVTGPVAIIGLCRLNVSKEFLRHVKDGKNRSIYSTGLRKNAAAGIVADQVVIHATLRTEIVYCPGLVNIKMRRTVRDAIPQDAASGKILMMAWMNKAVTPFPRPVRLRPSR